MNEKPLYQQIHGFLFLVRHMTKSREVKGEILNASRRYYTQIKNFKSDL